MKDADETKMPGSFSTQEYVEKKYGAYKPPAPMSDAEAFPLSPVVDRPKPWTNEKATK